MTERIEQQFCDVGPASIDGVLPDAGATCDGFDGQVSAVRLTTDAETQGLVELRKDPEPSTDNDRWLTALTPPDYQDRNLKLDETSMSAHLPRP